MLKRVEIQSIITTNHWDERIADFNDAGVFHTAAWARVLHCSYGYRTDAICLTGTEKVSAIMPFAEINSSFTGRRGVCLPFTDECPALLRADTNANEFVAQVLSVGMERRWRTFDCHGFSGFGTETPAAVEYLGHHLDLSLGETALHASFSPGNRRAIRKAERCGMEVTTSTDVNAVEDYYRLHCITRKRHGLPPQPVRFFRAIQRELLSKGNGFVVLAKQMGRAIAGAVFLWWNGRAVYKFGASDDNGRSLRANYLVMWQGIQALAEAGIRNLSFGRTSLVQSGLRQFKRGWGCVENRIRYVRFDFRQNRFVVTADRASGWHNRLFRVLPVSASRFIGECLYPHIG